MPGRVLKLRIFLWTVLTSVIFWLLYMGVVPSGRISYHYDFRDESYFIKKLTPAERVEPPQSGSQRIVGNPVYFALRTPRRFDKAILTLKYKNNGSLPLIEAGVLVDKIIWRYDLRPIENTILDDLSAKWNVIKEDGLTLLQREKKFQSVNEFLEHLPERREIALYNYKINENFSLPDYAPKIAENKIGYALQGAWQIYTYIKNENLDFSFAFEDLNKNKDADSIDLNLYSNGQLIDSRHLDDDGIFSDNGEKTQRGDLRLKLAGLPEGIYKAELKVNDDIMTKEIFTEQQKLSFINKLWLADAGQKNITLFSDSMIISAQTINPGRLQTLKVGENDLEMTETYRQFSIKTFSTAPEIKLEKDDVILAGDGVFSFNKNSLINPAFKKVDENFDADREGIDYILADYTPPSEKDGWNIASAEFDLRNAYREFYKYNFLISTPGLKVEDGVDNNIEMGEIKIELEGTGLRDKLRKILKK